MDEHLKALVERAVSSYEALKDKPWYKRWWFYLVALVAALVAALAITQAVNATQQRRAAIRVKRAEVIRATKLLRDEKDRYRRAQLAHNALVLKRELDALDAKAEADAAKLEEAKNAIRDAKDWKGLSSAMAKP